MCSPKAAIASAAMGLWAFSASAVTVTPEDVPGHIGETATVCGVVASAKFAPGSRAQPTFLDFGNPYPDAAFTDLIWGAIGPNSARPVRPGKFAPTAGSHRSSSMIRAS
jgi:hypothetical protein